MGQRELWGTGESLDVGSEVCCWDRRCRCAWGTGASRACLAGWARGPDGKASPCLLCFCLGHVLPGSSSRHWGGQTGSCPGNPDPRRSRRTTSVSRMATPPHSGVSREGGLVWAPAGQAASVGCLRTRCCWGNTVVGETLGRVSLGCWQKSTFD